jgi:hypothetical protein
MESPLSFDSTENFRKKLLLKNLKPYKVDGFYVSNDGSKNTEIVLIDYSVIDEQTVDVEAKLQEPKLIGLNKYTPIGGTFGELISINLNLNSETNLGNYTYIQSEGSKLQNFGRIKELELIVQNQYGPEGQQSKTTVTPNLNFQTKANEGNYGYSDSLGSDVELEGDKQEKLLRVLNKYSPSNIQNGYGDSVLFPLLTIGSNQGDYQYVSDGPNLTTIQSQDNAYTSNLYGPNGGFDDMINPNLNNQTQANKGQYNFGVSSPNRTTEQSQIVSYLANIFGPESQPNGFGVMINPNLDFQTQANQGEFNYETSSPNRTTEQSQTFLYAKNKYNNGDGTYEVLSIDDLAFENINEPYYNSDTTFVFQPSDYSPISILSQDNIDNIVGSEGSLSQDSDLAKLGAKQLQKEFKARVAFELLQQTLGRSTLSNTTIDVNTGGVSTQPNNDPFDSLGVLMNKIPVIQRDFKITSTGGIIGDSLGFVSRLAGLYSPYSLIPGEYFDYPAKNLLSQVASNPIGTVAGVVTNLATKILSLNIDSGSERLLANTSNATKSLLFDMLWYNQYRPQYKLDSILSPNLSAPNSNFYVGNDKNYFKNVVSPVTDLPKDKNGNPSIGPVYDYGRIGRDYEGNDVNKKLFGLNAKPFYDSVGIQGGFTWTAKKNYLDPGRFVGPKNDKTGNVTNFTIDSVFSSGFENTFNQTKSSDIGFTPGSILDVTQKLVEAGSAASSSKLEHVGNAINQISKVFNDGYVETTKGSRARRYLTPTAAGQTEGNEVKSVVGYEYCRLFTKDRPYYSFNELQKTDGNIRKYKSSVFDNTFNLNIAPMQSTNGVDSTNIINGKAKKYMFSIENLAWRTSNRTGFRVEDLPACEIGPNGGRIMWFPPYDLSFDDTTSTTWQDNVFLGRTEPVYTYSNTKRSGSIKFKIIVDHPSIMNVLVNKELEKADESEATKVIDSLFAGCVKYDLVDLLKKYPMFSYSDIYQVIESLSTVDQIKDLSSELPESVPTGEIVIEENATLDESTNTDTQSLIDELNNKDGNGQFEEIILLFPNAIPGGTGTESGDKYEAYYNQLKGLQSDYVSRLKVDPTALDGYYIKYSNKNIKQTTLPNNPPIKEITGEWIIAKPSATNTLFSELDTEYSDFGIFQEKVLKVLKSGAEVQFTLIASASANSGFEYNEILSQRRMDSVYKQIIEFSDGEKKIKDFIESTPPTLKITKKAEGKKSELKTEQYSNVDCSKPFKNENEDGIGSVQAMLCRRVSISGLVVKGGESVPEDKKPNEIGATEGQLPEPLAVDVNNPNNTPSQAALTPKVVNTVVKDKQNVLRTDLTKRLLRKLLSECNYFEMVKESNPMLYDGIKSKFKNFHPMFHSITPEGLNARLTFLNQCMRPGDTIPTAADYGGQTQFEYNDVFNSAFGTPPVCVLRVGDFYHSKIVIERLTLKYEDAKFDINPEGIGIQPMIAEVDLSFNFIGGHGIANPVAELQNALSFNYYANTEMYDDRATITDNVLSKFDSEILADIKNISGLVDPSDKPKGSGAGNTIGTVKTNSLDVQTSAITGTIEYKSKMDEFVKSTGAYFNTTFFNLNILKDYLNLGGLLLYTKQRKYKDGYFNYLGGVTGGTITTILGKPEKYQSTLNDLVSRAKDDVDNLLTPPLAQVEQQNFPNAQIRKVKRKLKTMIDEIKPAYLSFLDDAQTNIIKEELSFIALSDQLNFVVNKTDGYINKQGTPIIYNLSGKTDGVDPTSGAANTYDELKNDFLKVGSDLNEFMVKLDSYGIIPTGDTFTYKDDFKTQLFLKADENEESPPNVNVFFMLFGTMIIENPSTFVDNLVSSIGENETNIEEWKKFIYNNLGFSFENGTPAAKQNGIITDFKRSKNRTQSQFDKFKDDYLNDLLPNNEYKPFGSVEKTRVLDYVKQNTTNQTDAKNLNDVWQTVDSNGDKYNLKKQMN